MPVYPVLTIDATCSSSGCLCRDRSRAYPSDLTDGQWSVLEPRARAVMAELTCCAGRPMVHDLRAVLDAIAYVVRYGIEWRALPVGFPPHEAVYAFLCRWSQRGLPGQPADQRRERIRVDQGRSPDRRRPSSTRKASRPPMRSWLPAAATTPERRSRAANGA